MGTSCEIRFDNNVNNTFQSGSMLTGSVILNLSEKKKLRALYLKIEGSAKCLWTVSKGTGTHRRSMSYTGKEDYLNQVTYLLGSQSSTNLIEMPAGITSYTFACMLPQNLPSSVEGKYGNIRYSCKAVLERTSKADKEFRVTFSVIKTEDLNVSPTLFIASKTEIVRNFYCCCFKSKPFHMSASIPFTGFVAGQTIEVTIKINNQSNVDIEGTKVSLERNMQYICQNPRRKTKIENLAVKEVYGAGVRAAGSGEIKISLLVPPIAPTNVNFCKIITTSYQLRVVAKVSGAHKNPHLNIPVVIGTVPIRSAIQAPNYDIIMNNSSAPSGSVEPSAPPIIDLPPPSYEQAMQVVPEDANSSVFAPLYPVWNFSPAHMQMPMPIASSSPLKVPFN